MEQNIFFDRQCCIIFFQHLSFNILEIWNWKTEVKSRHFSVFIFFFSLLSLSLLLLLLLLLLLSSSSSLNSYLVFSVISTVRKITDKNKLEKGFLGIRKQTCLKLYSMGLTLQLKNFSIFCVSLWKHYLMRLLVCCHFCMFPSASYIFRYLKTKSSFHQVIRSSKMLLSNK